MEQICFTALLNYLFGPSELALSQASSRHSKHASTPVANRFAMAVLVMLLLTFRLFANMFAGEMVTLVFFSLVPIGVPIIFEGLHIGVSLIQTYIFVILNCVYLSEATAHEH